MDGRVLLRHHDDDYVADARLIEQTRRDLIDGRRTRPLAEAEDDQITSQRVHVAALEGVVHAPLGRSVVQDSAVGEDGVMRE